MLVHRSTLPSVHPVNPFRSSIYTTVVFIHQSILGTTIQPSTHPPTSSIRSSDKTARATVIHQQSVRSHPAVYKAVHTSIQPPISIAHFPSIYHPIHPFIPSESMDLLMETNPTDSNGCKTMNTPYPLCLTVVKPTLPLSPLVAQLPAPRASSVPI